MIEKEDLLGIIENAFKPLRCVAELHDYDETLGFRVYLPDGGHITRDDQSTEELQEKRHLEFAIIDMRTKIQDKGISLDAWSLKTS